MSFGVSPSDVVKLVEFSARIYVAFKDANDNSEAQVEALIREFSSFHECLVQLEELMTEYGKPLPFPYIDFKETLQKCDATLKPYANHLVDNKKMTAKKFAYTIKYIGKEKEIDNLRKQITGHYQALQFCISFLQLRLHLEATRQTQRLLDSVPFRAMSLGGHMYTSNAFASSSRPHPNALPPPSEADQLYKDWVVFNRWLKNEDDRVLAENSICSRPLSLGSSPIVSPCDNPEFAAAHYHLKRQVEDAVLLGEYRAKRVAIEKRVNLSPNDAMREEVKTMPRVPLRSYTLDTDHSGNFTRFQDNNVSTSPTCARHSPSPSITTSPSGSPQIQQSYFNPIDWGHLSPDHHTMKPVPTAPASNIGSISPSVSSSHSTTGVRADSPLKGLGVSPSKTPGDHTLRSRLSVASLATMALGEGALTWTKLTRKVDVERTSSKGIERKECDLHWRYGEDAGLSVRAVYRSGKDVKVFITQSFHATGPSIPLTTSYPDGETSIDFPRSSYGRLDKRCTDVKYTFSNADASTSLQTLLYTNNNKDRADLLYDRPVITISSDKNKPECRGKNIRLWRRTEEMECMDGPVRADVLVLLFYASALDEDKAHWVEEPHYIFQWLDESVYKKSSDKLLLIVSKDIGKWDRDKIFKGRKISQEIEENSKVNSLAIRRTSVASSLRRQQTVSSIASSTLSIAPPKLHAGGGYPRRDLNRFRYSELEIKFQSKRDRNDFLTIWKQYVKPLGVMSAT